MTAPKSRAAKITHAAESISKAGKDVSKAAVAKGISDNHTKIILYFLGGVFALSNAYLTVVATRNSNNISTLEKNTNSIKDALVKSVGEAEHAKGVIQGTVEEKGRDNAADEKARGNRK